MIALRQVSKSFDGGTTYAVRDLSLEVAPAETMVLLGSSGCGKTTTLKLINRLTEPTEGTVLVDGCDVQQQDSVELRRSIGYVFQGIGLFPHMSVQQNVEIVPRLLGWRAAKRQRRAHELLGLMGMPLEDYADRFPDELSGGQQQRVGVARALAADPSYLLMDEPFGALDAVTRDNLQQELLQLKRQLAKTVVFVTHDIFEALTLGDRIAILNEGRLEQVGTSGELLARPATEFVRELFGRPAKQLSEFKDLL
ncbi:MAG: ABC transporter ATP-binding protein [Acidobacteriota bacterium]